MKSLLILVIVLINLYLSNGFLRVHNKELFYNNDRVFLSGANIAWFSYALDFGSGAYNNVRSKYEQAIDEISNSGGNAIRVWVHIDGQNSPKFDSNGFATGADTSSLIKELGELLDHAAKKNVFVILCLWNLAVKPEKSMHLYTDEKKLESYLEKVLKPLAKGLANKPALGGYDIINEPSGSVIKNVSDPNPCYNTQILKNSGSDWTNAHLHYKDVQRFINHHADTIKSADPKALVTVGDGEQISTNICSDCRNYLSDHCLTSSGGKPKGTLDFYQLHSYTWQGKFGANSPFKKHSADYKMDKPIVVGEFATVCSESMNAVTNYKYLYESGYSGGLSWQYNEGGGCADKRSQTDAGLSAIKDMSSNGKIRIKM